MIRVRVVGVALDPAQQHVILLSPFDAAADGERVLPVWIGPQEAMSILVAIEGTAPPRPLAHDLMTAMLGELSATVDRVEITHLEDGTFYARLVVDTPRGQRSFDARPSDAIALGARVDAPIWVADSVFAEAGVPDDAVELDPSPEEERVEEFRRFLDDVDPEDFQG
ncbi:bifunctional nuclease family protein [Microbacterium sp. KSW4-17]|uniref:Bifunctional nuclease family protein n=1 Tax=Microbacterium galbum TaxID=3075994 RepID=A0ABU3T8T2_9MICO|nr:bifunctional nuclease family protein [Microbacterium sp. KSW4-17]MDU0367773.1 bifunctional nuclease family protein [Microbacterium sp. KSW4-17]